MRLELYCSIVCSCDLLNFHQPQEPAFDPSEEYKIPNYSSMYYKNGHRLGIRRKFGDGTQCFSFGGTKCQETKAELKCVGQEVLKKLDGGMSEEDAKTWAVGALAE